MLRRRDAGDDVVEQQRPLRKIGRRGVPVKLKAAALQILRHTRPTGQRTLQAVRIPFAARAHALRLLGQRRGLSAQAFALCAPAPEKIEDQTDHRRKKDGNDPRDLIGKVARLVVNVQCRDKGNALQRTVDGGKVAFQIPRQKKHRRNLQSKQHHNKQDTQRRGDAALPSLL